MFLSGTWITDEVMWLMYESGQCSHMTSSFAEEHELAEVRGQRSDWPQVNEKNISLRIK